ncbi:helix-turn-helix domain-containing protein [Streptomyces radicis]|uniref:XRE family transcriptional regulator n=1 Tax=Streptomyces radicis TaxID=1750517 RepID=A0A3A9WGV0_9ACTN|nr:helix-turn-helix domain-containing protein [Streptomyces radicis]RKN12258.1 hypothetical protein D7319_04480 [Streptomyces radicis]RKN26068.1 hypothetical protein D7318_06000 [Streptomyces radicis]
MDATHSLVSPDLLEREDLRRALAEHDFAAAFSLLKKYGGLSQNRLAAACRLTPGKVSTIIKGTHQVTSYDVIARIADGLRIPGQLLGLAARPWETPRSDGPVEAPSPHRDLTSSPWTPAAAVTAAARMTRTDLVIDRRTASRALTTITVGAPLLDALEGWLHTTPAGEGRRVGRLGTREVTQLEKTARLMRQWDHHVGGGLRRRAVLGQLAEVTEALGEHQTAAVERRLFCVLADLAGTAAGMAWDSGLHRTAQDYYRLALRAAHAGGDRAFGANILAGMARQMLYPDQDRPQDALELVRLAQQEARLAARVRSLLHAREAWAYASLGRPAAFHRAADQASATLAEAGPVEEDPYWIRYFGPAELAGTMGNRLLGLARHEPGRYTEAAIERIGAAVELRGTEAARSHALDWAGLAECSWLLGDIRSAVDRTHRAIEVARLTESKKVRVKLGRLYPYTVGHTANIAVREARHDLRELLTT